MTMKYIYLIPLIALSCCLSNAQEKLPVVSLFDGKLLEGWDFDPAIWRVEDGLMTGGSTTEKVKKNYFIATKKSYQNFELRLSIKCSGDSKTGLINSGIQVRSVRVPGGAHMAGYQVTARKLVFQPCRLVAGGSRDWREGAKNFRSTMWYLQIGNNSPLCLRPIWHWSVPCHGAHVQSEP